MPNTLGFRLYPRGFVGGVPALRMEKMQPQPLFSIHQSQGRIAVVQPGASELCVNEDIERLHASYIKEAGEVLGRPFRDKVLSAAFKAFGTMSFHRWVKEQRSSPGFGDMQYRFISDTMEYLQGSKRPVDMTVWEVSIEAGVPCPPPEKFKEVFFNFFGTTINDREQRPVRNDNLVDVIQMWCSRPNGIEDLLQTLHLLFGNP